MMPMPAQIHEMEFDAAHFAAAWLACSTSSKADQFRPVLSRTFSLELTWGEGVRITTISTEALTTAWVPELHSESTASIDRGGDVEWVVSDRDGRLAQLCNYVLRRCIEYHEDGDTWEPGSLPLDSGLRMKVLRKRAVRPQLQLASTESPPDAWFEFSGEETVVLDVIDTAFPGWRNQVPLTRLLAGSPTESVVLAHDKIEQLAKLAALSKRATRARGHVRISMDGPRDAMLLMPQALPGVLSLMMPDPVAAELREDDAATS